MLRPTTARPFRSPITVGASNFVSLSQGGYHRLYARSRGISQRLEQFTLANTAIVGCSGDSVQAQAKFKAKYNLNFPLLADTNFNVIEAYGARRMKTFFGKSPLGIVRVSFWIGPDGIIRKVWEKVTAKGHAAEVLAAIRIG